MKIAICMSGLTRTFKYCYPSFKKYILDRYDCDVFTLVSKDSNSDDIKLVDSKKCIIWENDPKLPECNYKKFCCKRYSLQGFLQQFLKIEVCNEMMKSYSKENNIKYDWIIRTRPDLMYTDYIDIDSFDKRYMYIPISHTGQRFFDNPKHFEKDFVFNYDSHPSMNDRMAICSEELMDVYSLRYKELDEIYKLMPGLHAEMSLHVHLRRHNVNIKFLPVMNNLYRS